MVSGKSFSKTGSLGARLGQVVVQLRQVQSAVVVAIAALRQQNCELDEDIATVLQRSVADQIHAQIEHLEEAINVPTYGRVDGPREVEYTHEQVWTGQKVVLGIPADMPIVGYLGQTVNWLRLFTARASEDFDIEIFNRGDYSRAVEQKMPAETIGVDAEIRQRRR